MSTTGNSLKQRLAEPGGGALIGLWLGLATAYTAEVCAGAGFDWVLVDGEHGPNDVRSILTQLQSVARFPTQAIVRPPEDSTHLIKQLLDIGARNLLIPMVESAEQAERLVRAVRYPPNGVRGVGAALARASNFNRQPDYLENADDGIALIVQIESQRGVDNLDDILAVDGIDALFIGPSDLAAMLGHLGNPAQPDVQALIASLFARIGNAGKPLGIFATEEKAARKYIEMGAKFVAVGTDVGVLVGGLQDLVGKFDFADAPGVQSSGGY